MSIDDPTGKKSNGLPKRSQRALTEKMTVIPDAPEMFTVTSESGSEYTVDVREPACTCPDFRHREPAGGCKHIRRVKFATGREPIPWYVNRDAVDPQIALHTDENPVVAASDGGVIETPAFEETDESDESDACDDCQSLPKGWSCAPCFIKGEGEIPEA